MAPKMRLPPGGHGAPALHAGEQLYRIGKRHPGAENGWRLGKSLAAAEKLLGELARDYGLEVPLHEKVEDLPVACNSGSRSSRRSIAVPAS